MPQLDEVRREDVESLVHTTITGILPWLREQGIDGSRHLKDLGADSVDRVEIILSLIERFGLDEPMSRFSEIPSVDALVDFLWEAKRS